MEGKLAGRLAAGIAVAALTVSGCTTSNEVGGINLVNCQKGPKSQEVTYPLVNVGNHVDLGGTSDSLGFNHVGSIRITLENNNALSIVDENPNVAVRYFPTSGKPQLEDGQVGIDSSGTIYASSMGIDYQVKSEVNNGNASLDITATCK